MLPPVALDGGVAFEVEAFLLCLAAARVVNKFRHAAAVADEPRLVGGHVIRHAVFRLAGGVALVECGAPILKPLKHGAVGFGAVGHGNLRDVRRTVAADERLRNALFLNQLAL